MPEEPLIDSDLLRRLEQLTLLSRKMSTARMKGERRGRQRGTSTDFADYRNYVHGDDLRHLDWKIYARLERLFLKLFLEEENLQVHILIDTSESMRFGEPEKQRYAQQVAAAIGYITLCKMDNLNVHTFGQGIVESFGPKRGKNNAHSYFHFLENLRPTERTSLTQSLNHFARSIRGKGLVILISDFYDMDGYESGLRLLFGRDFEVYGIHVLSPQELKPELEGDLQLVDIELGATTDVSMGKNILEVYERSLQTFCADLRQFIVSRGGTYLLSSTDLPFDKLVLDVLARRGLVA